jgi:hypothetical protein
MQAAMQAELDKVLRAVGEFHVRETVYWSRISASAR